ncbi:MAG TPA: phosphopantothenoylcysteine decarboxylase [Deltaproteobacteria bacterium]|nr:phosphopantothenoylcysteine decarboxylase [Deltaproteobacteria bacterium]
MRVLLGVTGGIAAYKAADLTSRLIKLDHEVRVVMTQSATTFVGPLTFEALSGNPVMTQALTTGQGTDGASAIEHISWAKWAEATIIAPLTASTLGRLACGLADDALTTVWMALPLGVPCLLCPAMNTAMWEHPVVQRNLGWLEALERYRVVAPSHKRLACGDVGIGGLAEIDEILGALAEVTEAPRGSAGR